MTNETRPNQPVFGFEAATLIANLIEQVVEDSSEDGSDGPVKTTEELRNAAFEFYGASADYETPEVIVVFNNGKKFKLTVTEV